MSFENAASADILDFYGLMGKRMTLIEPIAVFVARDKRQSLYKSNSPHVPHATVLFKLVYIFIIPKALCSHTNTLMVSVEPKLKNEVLNKIFLLTF